MYNSFMFDADVFKATKKDGSYYIFAKASDNLVDYHGDMMSKKALRSMVAAAKNGIPLRRSHDEAFEIGMSVDGKLRNVGNRTDFIVKVKLDMDYVEAKKLFKEVDEGKSRRQLSIGGKIDTNDDKAIEFKEVDGKIVRVINALMLDHISVTAPEYAANPRTSFMDAIIKSLYKTNVTEEDIATIESGAKTVEKGVVKFKKYPLADVDAPWSFTAEDRNAILVKFSGVSSIEEFEALPEDSDDKKKGWSWYKKAHAYVDDSEEDIPMKRSAYGLPHHKLDSDGEFKTFFRGAIAGIAALNGARGGFTRYESEEERHMLYEHLAKHVMEFDKEPPELLDLSVANCINQKDVIDGIVNFFKKQDVDCSWLYDEFCPVEKCRNLGAFLREELKKKEEDGKNKRDLISAMASESGRAVSTIESIISGDIVCPPIEVLQGVARGLGVPVSNVIDVAKKDGFIYDEEKSLYCKNVSSESEKEDSCIKLETNEKQDKLNENNILLDNFFEKLSKFVKISEEIEAQVNSDIIETSPEEVMDLFLECLKTGSLPGEYYFDKSSGLFVLCKEKDMINSIVDFLSNGKGKDMKEQNNSDAIELTKSDFEGVLSMGINDDIKKSTIIGNSTANADVIKDKIASDTKSIEVDNAENKSIDSNAKDEVTKNTVGNASISSDTGSSIGQDKIDVAQMKEILETMKSAFVELSNSLKEVKEEMKDMKKSVYRGNSIDGQEDFQMNKSNSKDDKEGGKFAGLLFG